MAIRNFLRTLRDILEFRILEVGDFTLSVSTILAVILIFALARLIIFVISVVIKRSFRKKKGADRSKEYTVTQLTKYFIYVIAFILAIDTFGVSISILIASSAALFVGIGLGLQKTFNDFFSGLVLLFENNIAVGDVVEVGSFTGIVRQINLRTSTIMTRDSITMIVPNSALVSDNVINWSHGNKLTRFHIGVGVAYGSDTAKVKEVLIKIAKEHPDVFKNPPPAVRMIDFGDSSLDFDLLFWTEKPWESEVIKSELRFKIDTAFRANGITIPFPQRDVYLKPVED